MPAAAAGDAVVEVRGLTFAYRGGDGPVLHDVELAIAPGTRALLVGANGAGKSTLLGILAGRHMVPPETVRVLGRPAFHDTSLVADVALLGGPFPFDVDMRVGEILGRTPGLDAGRVARLLEVLGVDPDWRMHRVSDGQRRRVQLVLGLGRPLRVLLLDEVTTDLDVVARADLLAFLREEAEARGVAILYATHIFDALDDWATHLVLMSRGRVARVVSVAEPVAEAEVLGALRARGVASPLARFAEGWIRAHR